MFLRFRPPWTKKSLPFSIGRNSHAPFSLERRSMVLDIIRREAIWFEPTDRLTECRDPKDDKYLELALASGAETIVSGDEDLLVLHPWRGIRIVNPADYLALT